MNRNTFLAGKQTDPVSQILQQIEQLDSCSVDLEQVIAEYHRAAGAIHASFLPRDVRNMAFAMAKARLVEHLKQYFL